MTDSKRHSPEFFSHSKPSIGPLKHLYPHWNAHFAKIQISLKALKTAIAEWIDDNRVTKEAGIEMIKEKIEDNFNESLQLVKSCYEACDKAETFVRTAMTLKKYTPDQMSELVNWLKEVRGFEKELDNAIKKYPTIDKEFNLNVAFKKFREDENEISSPKVKRGG